MQHLSLRLRVFLFFGLIGVGGLAVVMAALGLGYRQLGDRNALSAFVTVGVVAAFGILGLAAFVWRMFDENLSKPIEALAAQFRMRANAGIVGDIDKQTARYLGDLAPAAQAIAQKLGAAAQATAETVAQRTARLERQRAQLLRILSDLPVAVLVATQDHQIVLYDGQAAGLLEREGSARLHGSVCDYLDAGTLEAAIAALGRAGAMRRPIAIKGKSGTVYSGHIRVFDGDDGYMLMLEPLASDAARPLVYDFDVRDKVSAGTTGDVPLSDLVFVVFDSETTGLDPETDEVVQLGAVRIVNGRIVAAETFDRLVKPVRPIPPLATRVHGISTAMVADAAGYAEVRGAFRSFAGDAVLVAHNAPFDMAFLNGRLAAQAAPFENPVMDTVHLSAIVFGGSASHTLDALCGRLGVAIAQDARHTALGDAMATAQALVAMLPILEARGLRTYAEVREEARKHSRILKLQG